MMRNVQYSIAKKWSGQRRLELWDGPWSSLAKARAQFFKRQYDAPDTQGSFFVVREIVEVVPFPKETSL